MQNFKTYLVNTNPALNRDEIKICMDYIINKYSKIKNVKIESIPPHAVISDMYNYIDIPRPEKWDFDKNINIILPDFFKNLHYDPYEGSSETFYKKYTKPVRNESQLLKVVKFCDSVFHFIINPSALVIAEYCRKYSFRLDEFKNISKELLLECIKNDYHVYKKYAHRLDEYEILDLIGVNPKIIGLIVNLTYEMKLKAIDVDPNAISYIKEQTLELCKNSIRQIYKNYLLGNEIQINASEFKFFDEEIVDLILDIPKFKVKFENIPNYLWTMERIIKAIKNDPFIISNAYLEKLNQECYQTAFDTNIGILKYIPIIFQTKKMKEIVKEKNPIQFEENRIYLLKTKWEYAKWEYAKQNPVKMSQKLCDKIFAQFVDQFKYIPAEFQTQNMVECLKKYHFRGYLIPYIANKSEGLYICFFNKNTDNIKYIPAEFQTVEMCEKSANDNKMNVEYCEHITENMLRKIFENSSCRRKERFDFINNFNEKALAKILTVRPHLLGIITKQTDYLIRTALKHNGYCFQNIHNKTIDYLRLALENQPLAIKYASLELVEQL